MSAVKNALQRSAKFEKDKIEQNVDYVTFQKRPNTVQKGKVFNLKDTVMQIHQRGQDPKLVAYDQLTDYGIVSDYKDGDKLPPIGTTGLIHFKNSQCLITLPTEFQVQKDNSICEPTHILLKNKKGAEKRIDLSNDKTVYKAEFVGEITSVALYYKNKKIVEGKYDEEVGDYTFSLRDVRPPAGADKWIHENYNLLVDTDGDTSPIASFKVIDSLVKKDYRVGQTLDLGRLKIAATTKQGSKKRITGWGACAEAGFVATPNNGYRFLTKDCGKVPIKIQYKDDAGSVQTFMVEVVDEAEQTPAKIEVYSGNDKITTVDINQAEFKESPDAFTVEDIPLEAKYKEALENNKLTFKVLNSKDKVLEASATYDAGLVQVNLPKYITESGDTANIFLAFAVEE